MTNIVYFKLDKLKTWKDEGVEFCTSEIQVFIILKCQVYTKFKWFRGGRKDCGYQIKMQIHLHPLSTIQK